MDHSLLGFSVHGISQSRILEWVVLSVSGDLPTPAFKPKSPSLPGGFFTTGPLGLPFHPGYPGPIPGQEIKISLQDPSLLSLWHHICHLSKWATAGQREHYLQTERGGAIAAQHPLSWKETKERTEGGEVRRHQDRGKDEGRKISACMSILWPPGFRKADLQDVVRLKQEIHQLPHGEAAFSGHRCPGPLLRRGRWPCIDATKYVTYQGSWPP